MNTCGKWNTATFIFQKVHFQACIPHGGPADIACLLLHGSIS